MSYLRLLIAIALVSLGCSKNLPASGPRTELAVWAYETFPPEAGTQPVRFRLTREELDRVKAYIPDVSRADDHQCKCGVPRFGVALYDPGATTPFAEGDFFHGPDQLTLTFEGRGSGRLLGQQAFHDALVAVLQARGHWK